MTDAVLRHKMVLTELRKGKNGEDHGGQRSEISAPDPYEDIQNVKKARGGCATPAFFYQHLSVCVPDGAGTGE